MKNTLILIIFVSLYISSAYYFTGCKEDTPVVPPGNTDPGILKTDEFGNILGGDTTDWCIHDSAEVTFGPAYPNPVLGSIFRVKFHVSTSDIVKIYILKSQTDTIEYYKELAQPGYYEITINDSQFVNTYQRLYFKSSHYSSSQYCRFYGDVKFEE
jgi:hypothetical protein